MTPRNDRTAKDYERKDVDGNVNQQLSMDIMVSELQQLEAEEQGVGSLWGSMQRGVILGLMDWRLSQSKNVIFRKARETLTQRKMIGATTIGNEELFGINIARIIEEHGKDIYHV
ncbi:hypothetical protein V6N13_036611 [Hibiscus sabdariffa]